MSDPKINNTNKSGLSNFLKLAIFLIKKFIKWGIILHFTFVMSALAYYLDFAGPYPAIHFYNPLRNISNPIVDCFVGTKLNGYPRYTADYIINFVLAVQKVVSTSFNTVYTFLMSIIK